MDTFQPILLTDTGISDKKWQTFQKKVKSYEKNNKSVINLKEKHHFFFIGNSISGIGIGLNFGYWYIHILAFNTYWHSICAVAQVGGGALVLEPPPSQIKTMVIFDGAPPLIDFWSPKIIQKH